MGSVGLAMLAAGMLSCLFSLSLSEVAILAVAGLAVVSVTLPETVAGTDSFFAAILGSCTTHRLADLTSFTAVIQLEFKSTLQSDTKLNSQTTDRCTCILLSCRKGHASDQAHLRYRLMSGDSQTERYNSGQLQCTLQRSMLAHRPGTQDLNFYLAFLGLLFFTK